MSVRTIIGIAVVVILLAGAQFYRSYSDSVREEQTLQAAKNAASAAAMTHTLRGEWIGENGGLVLSGDNSFRESVSQRITEAKGGLSYSFKLAYVLGGRWRADTKGLTQEVTDVTQVTVTEIEASSSSVNTSDQATFLRNLQDELPRSVSQNLRKELVGKTFVTRPAFPSPGTLILQGSEEARRYSRIQ